MQDLSLPPHVDPLCTTPDWQDWLRLSLTPRIGLLLQHRLVSTFGSASAVFAQPEVSLRSLLNDAQVQALQQWPP